MNRFNNQLVSHITHNVVQLQSAFLETRDMQVDQPGARNESTDLNRHVVFTGVDIKALQPKTPDILQSNRNLARSTQDGSRVPLCDNVDAMRVFAVRVIENQRTISLASADQQLDVLSA